ncbi:MAG: hypothetical protein JWN96_3024 [Mycobacterium sp.]|jgi:hypothetical protein|nr:hypothetical protein [Mycobacterium sp.]
MCPHGDVDSDGLIAARFADIANEKANFTYGCLGTGVNSQTAITLAAPLGSRTLVDDSGERP